MRQRRNSHGNTPPRREQYYERSIYPLVSTTIQDRAHTPQDYRYNPYGNYHHAPPNREMNTPSTSSHNVPPQPIHNSYHQYTVDNPSEYGAPTLQQYAQYYDNHHLNAQNYQQQPQERRAQSTRSPSYNDRGHTPQQSPQYDHNDQQYTESTSSTNSSNDFRRYPPIDSPTYSSTNTPTSAPDDCLNKGDEQQSTQPYPIPSSEYVQKERYVWEETEGRKQQYEWNLNESKRQEEENKQYFEKRRAASEKNKALVEKDEKEKWEAYEKIKQKETEAIQKKREAIRMKRETAEAMKEKNRLKKIVAEKETARLKKELREKDKQKDQNKAGNSRDRVSPRQSVSPMSDESSSSATQRNEEQRNRELSEEAIQENGPVSYQKYSDDCRERAAFKNRNKKTGRFEKVCEATPEHRQRNPEAPGNLLDHHMAPEIRPVAREPHRNKFASREEFKKNCQKLACHSIKEKGRFKKVKK